MMDQNIDLYESILIDREARADYVYNLAVKYVKTVLVGRVNYPGSNKNTMDALKVFNELVYDLTLNYQEYVTDVETWRGADGPAYIMIFEEPPESIKKMGVSLEKNSPIGRLYDIDVYTSYGEQISRTAIGESVRACIVCGDEAKKCAALRSHKLTEIMDAINQVLKQQAE